MEIAQIIDDALEEYYSEQGLPVPNWKQKKDPQWWTDYLNELGIDKDNPCLLYTSPSPRDATLSRMPSSA